MSILQLALRASFGFVLITLSQRCFAQGFVLPGVGAVNRSMGGAGTAAPLDAVGALQWNPGSITGLPTNRFDLGVDLVANQNKVTSTLFAGTPGEITGTTHSHAGVAPLPALGVVTHSEDDCWSYGLGMFAIGGFAVNYPTSLTNPIFTPPMPVGVGSGGNYSRLSLLQVVPTVARKLPNGFSIGIAPTITIADAQLDPFPLAAPDDANGDMFFSFPPALRGRPRWGLGVQAGVYYESPSGVNLGLAIKSPQWFEDFEFFSADELGVPREVSTQLEYPMIITGGAAYKPTEFTLLAIDLRYVDYDNTPVFGDPAGFNPDGSLTGLNWESSFVVAVGFQWEVTGSTTLRTGYSYNTSPIQDETVFLSVSAPAVYEHIFNLGLSHQLTENVIFSATWVHAFERSQSGPILSPLGPVPLSDVTVHQAVDTAVLSVSYTF